MKKIVNYENNNTFCILITIYYEYEKTPAWRKVFTGSKEECEKFALESEKVQKFLDGKSVVKVIVVPQKLVNIVAK